MGAILKPEVRGTTRVVIEDRNGLRFTVLNWYGGRVILKKGCVATK